jgi:lambda family phage tail tape measure protein
MAVSILRDLAQMLIKQAAYNALLMAMKAISAGGGWGATAVSAISSIFSKSANGNVFSNGNVMAFANGGVVGGPTLFPMANGMGLMGEAGPEAVMPLKRGSDGKLGVASQGGSSINIVNNINIQNGNELNDETKSKKIFGEMSRMIKEQVRSTLKDETRVGGMLNTSINRRVV